MFGEGDGLRLNHPLVNHILELQKELVKKSHWKMNVKHFAKLESKTNNNNKNLNQDVSFFSKMQKVIKFYEIFCKWKVTKFKVIEVNLSKL
jgi:hypothetical protein